MRKRGVDFEEGFDGVYVHTSEMLVSATEVEGIIKSLMSQSDKYYTKMQERGLFIPPKEWFEFRLSEN